LKIKLTQNSKRKVTKKFEVEGAEKVQIVWKVSLLKKVFDWRKFINKCSKISSKKKLKNQTSKKFKNNVTKSSKVRFDNKITNYTMYSVNFAFQLS
jgi:hypothetical protein